MFGSSSDGKGSSSTRSPTSNYHLRSPPSSASKRRIRQLAELAALDAAPELAVPIELARSLKRSSARSIEGSSPILIPPRDDEPLLTFGKERIRVTHKKGLTFIQVERAKGVSLVEGLALAVVGTVGYEWAVNGAGNIIPGVGTNAIGIPFRNVFGGGGWNPLNYLVVG